MPAPVYAIAQHAMGIIRMLILYVYVHFIYCCFEFSFHLLAIVDILG